MRALHRDHYSIDAWLAEAHRTTDLLVHEDTYLDDTHTTTSVGRILDELMDGLPELQRRSIELVFISRFSYRDAARYLDLYLTSGRPDGKKVYRAAARGIARLRAGLTDGPESGWIGALACGRIPEEEHDGG